MARISMMKQSNSVTMDTGFDEFIQQCRTKNLSEKTIKNYSQQWKYFVQWFDSDRVCDISKDAITAYIQYMQRKEIAVESINTALRHIRAVVNYFNTESYCQPIKIQLLKVEQKIKDCYTVEELSILLKKPDIPKCGFTEFRTWTIINFLTGTGIRVKSLVNIKIQDLDFVNGLVTITTTKNKRPQLLPLPDSLQTVLRAYLKHRGGQPQDFLFPSENNTRLLETSVYHDVERFNQSRGVDKKGLHLFRHTFGKQWVLNGGDVFRLQKQLGHSTLTMSQKYANIWDSDLKSSTQFNLLETLQTATERITMLKGKKR